MSDNAPPEKSNLSFSGRKAHAKVLERMAATRPSQASLLYSVSHEVSDQI